MASYDKNLFHAVDNEGTSSVREILYDLSQKTDTNLKSVINQRNEHNQTPLHIACSKLHSDITQILLEAGADPNVQDDEGRTPCLMLILRLQDCNCEDCSKKAIRCVAVLAYHGASMDIPNQSGVTPLWMCAEYRFADCAKALLESGAALGTSKGKAMIEILVEKVPAVLETVFDRAVKIKGNRSIHDLDYEMTLDLGTVLPPQITLSKHVGPNSNGHFNQVFPADQWFNDKYEASEEMTFIKQLLDFSENDVTAYKTLLRHPLVNVFTDIKWKSLECLYVLFLVLQVVVLIAYSAFICATIFIDCPYNIYLNLQKGLDTVNQHVFPSGTATFNATKIINPDQLCEINIISKIISVFVVCCTLLILVKEVQHAVYDIKEYMKDFFNYFQLIGFISVIYTVIVAWNQRSPLYQFLYPVSAFGITISWCQLFVQIGRLPHLAIFVEMFVKIAINFCLSLAIYSCLLIGFAFSFSILFPAKPRLLNIPLAIIKVLSMLVGELDYDNLFSDDDDNDSTNATDTSSQNSPYKMGTRHPFAAHVWYLTFLVFFTLVLMNLLVGLAVSDIQGIRKNAEIYVIKRRIRYIAYLESILFEATTFLPAVVKNFMRENVAIARSKEDSSKFLCCFNFLCSPVDLKNCKLTIRPNDPKCKLLSNESKMSIRHWVLSKSISSMTRHCAGGRVGNSPTNTTGFRQRNLANFRKGSTSSFVGIQQQIFVKDQATQGGTDTERLKRLEFNVQQMDKKINELDLKLEMILKTVLRPETPSDV